MRKVLLAGVAALGLTITAPTAEAAYTGTTPGTNDVIGNIEGWFASTWFLIAGANTSIDVFYIGKEAGATNSFTINGVGDSVTVSTSGRPNTGLSNLVSPGGVAPTYIDTLNVAPGLIDFSFTTDFYSPSKTVTNALNPAPLVTPNFFAVVKTCDVSLPLNGTTCSFAGGGTASAGNTLLLALDDGGGGDPSRPDDNHDDLVVVIRISNGSFQVPEPATLGLLGAGLLGLGFAARRRRQA